MVLFMTRPTKRSGSSRSQFKKRVPSDVLKLARGKQVYFSLPKAHTSDEQLLVAAKVGTHIEFSLRTSEASLAKLRLGKATEQFERFCAAYREGPRSLTLKQCHALAGVVYHDLANGGFEDDPITEDWWRIVHEVVHDVLTAPTLTIDRFPDEGKLRRLDKFVGPFVTPTLSRLTDMNFGERYVHATGKVKRCYRELTPRAGIILGKWLADTLGIGGLHLARLEKEDAERRNAGRRELDDALSNLS